MLLNLAHRGATGSEANSGDGAGILLQTPDLFLREQCEAEGFELPVFGSYAVGMVFLPTDSTDRAECESLFERIVAEEGQQVLGWRTVPTDDSNIGRTARLSEPAIRQVFVARSRDVADAASFERKLYVIRRRVTRAVKA